MTITELPPPAPGSEILDGGPPIEVRDERLEAGAASIAEGRRSGSIVLNERFLVALAGAFMSAGLVAIVLGWVGASRSILVVKQIPYLISGGLLGVALATIGGLMFFTHWLAAILRENRFQHQELVRVLREERERDRAALAEAIAEVRASAAAEPATTAPKAPARRRPAKEG